MTKTETKQEELITTAIFDTRRNHVINVGDIYQGQESCPFYKINKLYKSGKGYFAVEHIGTKDSFPLIDEFENIRKKKFLGNHYLNPEILEKINEDPWSTNKYFEPFEGYSEEPKEETLTTSSTQNNLFNDTKSVVPELTEQKETKKVEKVEETVSEKEIVEDEETNQLNKRLEFKITAPTNDIFATAIEFNFEEMKEIIETKTKNYAEITYTENQFAEAKADRAKLNKLKDTINNEKIRIKKCVLEYYDGSFEPKVKELMQIIDVAIQAIDKQVKSFEQNKKDEKEKELSDYFYSIYNFAYLDISYDMIKKPEWLNATFSLKKAKIEIENITKQIEKDIDLIVGFGTENQAALLNRYKETLKLDEVIRYKDAIEKQEAKTEITKAVTPPKPVNKAEKQYVINFTVTGSMEQMQLLRNFLKNNNFNYKFNN